MTLATFHLGGEMVGGGRKELRAAFLSMKFSLSALTFPFQLNAYSTKTLTFKQAAHPAHVFILQADHFPDPSFFGATAKKVVWHFCYSVPWLFEKYRETGGCEIKGSVI